MYDTDLRLAAVPRHKQAQSDASELSKISFVTVAGANRMRLGEILLRAKRITSAQLEHALELQRQHGGRLGEILVGLGWLDNATLDAALAAQAAQRDFPQE